MMAPRPIRVLHVTTSVASSGGIEESLRILFERIDAARFSMALYAVQDRLDAVPAHFTLSATSLYCGERRGHLLDGVATARIARTIRDFGADIVHTHTNKGCWHGRLAARWMGSPAVVSSFYDMSDIAFSRTPVTARPVSCADVHDEPDAGFLATRVYPFLNVALNRFSDVVTACSDPVRRIYTADPADPMFRTIHLAYDDHVFSPRRRDDTAPATIGVVGRLVVQKGHCYLLEALAELHRDYPHLQLKIVGDGPLRVTLQELTSTLNLTRHVAFCGNIRDKSQLHEGIDIYVQPSISEGFPLAVQEAMGCGLPIIASRLEGIERMITDGEHGILVPPKEPAAIAAAVRRFMVDPPAMRLLGANAYKRALSEFSAATFANRMQDIYEELAGRDAH